MLEMQGFDRSPDDIEDEVWEIDADGNLVKVEVADDVEDDPAQG